MPNNIYTDDSIKSLSGRDFCRLRPATYLGSNEHSTQLVREVFANALDEYNIGHGNEITVEIDTKNNVYTVTDNGQGFPVNVIREDGETVLQASFDVINTSGKYDEDGVYSGTSLGLNGIGAKLTNFLSKWLVVTTYNGGVLECCNFEDGIFKVRETRECDHTNGTTVSWKPDEQFFQDSKVNLTELKKYFYETAALCPTLTINLIIDGSKQIMHLENGLNALIDERVGDKEIIKNRFSVRKDAGKLMLDIVFTYTSDYSETTVAYVNHGFTESGIHISTVKSLMTKQFNKYALDQGIIKKEEDGFTSAELGEGLVLVFNAKAPDVKYDSQTKVRVVDLDRSLIRNVINNDLPVWISNNQKDARLILDRAMLARKAKDAAQRAKDNIRGAKNTGKKFISLPTKLVDAYSKKRSECELFITEGDSAANGFKAKRDGATQAVFPIRGKILSCRKATPDKVYANQEISNIVKAIGLDIDKETGKLIYDVKKLRYGKIILATDADPDGYSIRMLLINMFWWLCPELVINGHICAAVPPLYRITNKKNEYLYLLDDKALADYKDKHKNETYSVNRLKGLGEMDSNELSYCLIKTETRNIQDIVVEDANEADDMLECFMGDDVSIRREYLISHLSLQ